MRDRFNREINYLRISVTDRCNLRCIYCIPEEGIKLKKHNEILSFEKIYQIAQTAVNEFGFKKIRLTGGEPLTRRNIINLVQMLASIDGIEELTMTTNGILLKQYAHNLKISGLTRVNVSLDTLNPNRFAEITRGGDLSQVLLGIEAAIDANLKPIKINCVVTQSANEKDAQLVKKYAKTKGIKVRFIKQMDLVHGIFQKIEGGEAGECRTCNRIRVLSDGRILPCLFSDKTYSIFELELHEALKQAIQYKPEKGTHCSAKCMASIGG